MKTFPFNGTLNFSIKNTGGCRPSAQSLEINHGDLSINSANNHYAAQTLSVSCDVPTNIRFPVKQYNSGIQPWSAIFGWSGSWLGLHCFD